MRLEGQAFYGVVARRVIVALVSVPKKVAGVTLGVLVRSMATAQTKRSEVVV